MTTPTHAETARQLAADLNTNARNQTDMARILERYLTAAHAQGWDAACERCAITALQNGGSVLVADAIRALKGGAK